MKTQKKSGGVWVGGGGVVGSGPGGQDGCKQRIEVFVKIKKKSGGGVGLGGRVWGSGWM